MKIFFSFILIVWSLALYAQTNSIDTVINRKHYAWVDYYKNGKVKSLGNYQDTLKTADWVYFTKKGKVLAFGKYKRGKKFGIWTYYSKEERYTIKWTDKYSPDEIFEYDKKGNLVIIDMSYSSPCYHTYRNGILRMTARTL